MNNYHNGPVELLFDWTKGQAFEYPSFVFGLRSFKQTFKAAFQLCLCIVFSGFPESFTYFRAKLLNSLKCITGPDNSERRI